MWDALHTEAKVCLDTVCPWCYSGVVDSFAAKVLWTIGRLVISGRSTTVRMPANVPPPSPVPVQPLATTEMPTTSETVQELKRRLGKEIYRMEMDLQGGGRIAGKPCDCLDNKHTLFLEAAAEELVSQEPTNPVYLEIIQWVKDNQPRVTVEAIASGQYKGEYPQMASQFKDFRKRVMGTTAFSAMEVPGNSLTLEDAKKLAAETAAQEVERQWQSQEKT